jgi:hydrogenase maturation factor
MCLAIPGRIVEVSGLDRRVATVEIKTEPRATLELLVRMGAPYCQELDDIRAGPVP